MPTYQYACTECGHAFDQVQKFSDDALTVCPVCEGRLRKVYNAVGVVFKGSGFYRNDSRPADASSSDSSSSTKTETKTSDSSSPKESSSTPAKESKPAPAAKPAASTPSSSGSGSSGSSSPSS